MADEAPARLWSAPTSVWAYGALRAAAFGVPIATGTGGVGLGLLVVLPLWVLLIRGSQWAWSVLLVLDSLLFAMTLAAQRTVDAPLLLPILSGAALAALLLPSVRTHVTSRRPAAVE